MAAESSIKIRLYKYASENSIPTDSILDLLKKKGLEPKGIQTILTNEMLDAINDHFKKDIEKKEKATKKIAEMQKKRDDKKEKVKEVKTPVKEAVVETTHPKQVETAPEISKPVNVEIQEQPAVVVQSHAVAETPKEEAPAVKTEKPEQKKILRTAAGRAANGKGLKIVGTFDLDGAEPIAEVADETVKTEELKPKKKKKKPRAKRKIEADESIDAKKKIKKIEIDEGEVKVAIKETLRSMDESVLSQRALQRRKKKRERAEEEIKRQEIRDLESNKLVVTEFIAVNELANLMGVPVGEVIQKCISLGLMVSINQRLEMDTITVVADEFGFEVEKAKEYTSNILEDVPDSPDSVKDRSPIVTIMGHVDHGKTSLLDYIRRTNVVAGESGGITQHIGAYKVEIPNHKTITFLDTPGHEAFTAMRARGAQITDIVILVVAADDAVMPQTIEAISHAQAANVPIVVAINKIDKPDANIDRIRQQLADRNVLVEDWGGKYQCVQISAKAGTNIDALLEKILLEAEVMELKANPDRLARGVVIESELDKGRGVTVTVLVQKGTLKIGDPFVAGNFSGRVRAMFDERGHKISEAAPSTPALVLGLEGAPQAGDVFIVVESERDAKDVATKRQQLKREQDHKQVHHITLDEISKQISLGGVKELPIIVKGDVDGSVEALADSLMKLSREEVKVRVIHRGVGAISEGDVLLASASNAIIIGFHVRPNLNARKLAEIEKVDIRFYNIIYNAINEVKSALEGLLSPVISEEVTSTVEVREIFKVPKVGTVAGCYVQDGKIHRNNKVRVLRDGIVIFEGDIFALKRFKDDVREVDAGYECGISLHNFNDIKISDIIEGYKVVETKKKLT